MNAIAKTLIVAWLIFMALAVFMGTAQGTECEMSERSARGYCPGTTGHQDELDGLPEPSLDDCWINGIDQCAPYRDKLPHTGIDTCLAAAGALSLIMVGGALVNIYGRDEE